MNFRDDNVQSNYTFYIYNYYSIAILVCYHSTVTKRLNGSRQNIRTALPVTITV